MLHALIAVWCLSLFFGAPRAPSGACSCSLMLLERCLMVVLVLWCASNTARWLSSFFGAPQTPPGGCPCSPARLERCLEVVIWCTWLHAWCAWLHARCAIWEPRLLRWPWMGAVPWCACYALAGHSAAGQGGRGPQPGCDFPAAAGSAGGLSAVTLCKETELRLGYRACQLIGICIVTFPPV